MKRPYLSISLVILTAITVPFLLAWAAAGSGYVFAGLLLNPMDGATYLAKMQQGWEGAWRFSLAFTAEPGEGAYLFLFYMFLGHVARWTGLPVVLVFHAFRLIGAGLLLAAIIRFLRLVFRDLPHLHMPASWLAVIGSGMGWLFIFSGTMTSDVWVAEGYPFLSMFANPHFPTGLACLLFVFTLLIDSGARYWLPLLAVIGLAISIILPFGVVVMLLVAGTAAAWRWLEERRLDWQPVVSLGILSGPFLLYQFWVAQTDPVLAGWNAQNITTTPPVWDVALSFTPALILALPGAACLWRDRHNPARRLLLGWFAAGLILIYIPFALQRRFMLGFYLPTAALAMFGLSMLWERFPARKRLFTGLLFGASVITNIVLLLILVLGALTHPPELYLTRDEAAVLSWMRTYTPTQSLVLASPQMGQWIPGFSGRRVIYGHPYETVNAEEEKAAVTGFFQSTSLQSDFLQARGVDYILFGPQEQELGSPAGLTSLPLVYQSGQVSLYQVSP